MLKTLVLLNIFVETMMPTFFFYIQASKEQHLFEMERVINLSHRKIMSW